MPTLVDRLAAKFDDYVALVCSAVFGTTTVEDVACLVEGFCDRELGASVEESLWFHASVGCVFGVRLADGTEVAIKAYQSRWTERFLIGVRAVQAHLSVHGFPCAHPLGGPFPLGRANATVEAILPDPGAASGAPDQLGASASGLARQIGLCRALSGDGLSPHPMDTPANQLYPEPHSPIFDFAATSSGAEWIDDLARRAKVIHEGSQSPSVVAHCDWSARNVRLHRDGIVAAYDWDSLALVRETTAVGQAAATWSAATGGEEAPSVEEITAYVEAYEAERGQRFSDDERAAVGGAALFVMAYTGRCEHSNDPDGGTRGRARSLLASSGKRLLSLASEFC